MGHTAISGTVYHKVRKDTRIPIVLRVSFTWWYTVMKFGNLCGWELMLKIISSMLASSSCMGHYREDIISNVTVCS